MSTPQSPLAALRRHRLRHLAPHRAGEVAALGQPAAHRRWLTTPWRGVERAPAPQIVRALAGRRIIVAERDPAGMRSMVDYLYAHGAIVHDAQCTADLLELVLADRPDGLVLDARLPASDVCALIRRLRTRDRHAAPMCIIAISASHCEQERDRHLAAGATSVLARPLCLRALVEQLAQICD